MRSLSDSKEIMPEHPEKMIDRTSPTLPEKGSVADSVVIIPTYNERENTAAIIDAVQALPVPFDIIIVDDASPDGTAAIVREKQAQYPDRIYLHERSGKLGLGTAYIEGFRIALKNPSHKYILRWTRIFRTILPI